MLVPMATLPAIFFGHGNPMNAIGTNAWTEAWSAIGRALPRPRAILCVSAHWCLPGTAVTATAAPRTIHDFGGFPRELYEVSYPARGDRALAERVQALLAPVPVALDERWGLDHGTWSVLRHVYPEADVPVVQLGIDETEPASYHYALGRKLRPLRDEGVLVIGSGNLVHNLHAYGWGRRDVQPYDWALRFEKLAREFVKQGDDAALVAYESLGRDALLAAPTADHFLPLVYVLGLRRQADDVTFPVEGFDGGSVSMLSIRLG
jgi:4,5-DOPA dioxygenase extradiol